MSLIGGKDVPDKGKGEHDDMTRHETRSRSQACRANKVMGTWYWRARLRVGGVVCVIGVRPPKDTHRGPCDPQ